jgi:ubiquinone/menaquinone biosynthesis C-methylase UbiE
MAPLLDDEAVAQRPCQTRAMAAADAKRIFTGIAVSYDRVATILSLGQDPRWRRALVDAIDARHGTGVKPVSTTCARCG